MRTWRQALIIFVFGFSLTGCATIFRSSKVKVVVDSEPAGANVTTEERRNEPTPAQIEVKRKGTSEVKVTKQGYDDHRGLVKKRLNPAWVVVDACTCIVTFCIPLLVDAISGAWYDVGERYEAKLTPLGATGLATSGTATPAGTAPTSGVGPAPVAPVNHPEMSESERKATARAAYIEGISLQEKNNCAEALPRFETAQKLFNAPTHLLHIGECQVATNKLVEAQETYEALTRANLGAQPPEAFKQAQVEGQKELAALKPRIPTLRVQITPSPMTLQNPVVRINGASVPPELTGIARPVNPGTYKVSASASGFRETSGEVDVKEGTQKSLDLKLSK